VGTKTIKYRIDGRRRKKSKRTYYYLIREFKVEKKRCVISKFIKSGSYPTKIEIIKFLGKNIRDIEERAQEKYIQSRLETITTEFLKPETAKSIERIRYLYNYLNTLISIDETQYFKNEADYTYIHGTTAIEGNTFSIGETKELLEHGTLPNGKSAREIYEIQNYKEVIKYRNSFSGKITLSFIKNLHKRIMNNIINEPGEFRTTDDICISGYDYIIPAAILIEDELNNLISWYYQKIADGYNVFESAVIFHYRFETIHPFIDGNGRVGRELLNYLLIKGKYPIILLPGEKRGEYLSALHSGNNEDFCTMIQYFAEMEIRERLKKIEENIDQQLEIRIKGSFDNKSQHSLLEFI